MVSITHPFWLGKTEVTHKEFERILGATQSIKNSSRLPVEVQLEEASADFVPGSMQNTLLSRIHLEITDRSRMFACRAGSTGPYSGTERILSTSKGYL